MNNTLSHTQQQKTSSQRACILAHLQKGKTLSPLEALALFGCLRLSARICELRQMGYPIINIWGGDGRKKWAVYMMKKGGAQ